MENLNLKQQSCQAKVIGTVISIAGAFIVTLYKGTPLNFSSNVVFGGKETYLSVQSNWIIGGFLLATASLCISVLLIVQVLNQTNHSGHVHNSFCSLMFSLSYKIFSPKINIPKHVKVI